MFSMWDVVYCRRDICRQMMFEIGEVCDVGRSR